MYTSSISVDQVIDALAAFLAPFCPGAQIARGQVNRVPMAPSPCVYLTEVLQVKLAVPNTDYRPDDDEADIGSRRRIDIQMDFYGLPAGEFAAAVSTAFASHWGFAHFPSNIKPLYTSDPVQAPLTTGEQQYESRWTSTAALQYNPTVTVPQEFADVVTPTIIQAD